MLIVFLWGRQISDILLKLGLRRISHRWEGHHHPLFWFPAHGPSFHAVLCPLAVPISVPPVPNTRGTNGIWQVLAKKGESGTFLHPTLVPPCGLCAWSLEATGLRPFWSWFPGISPWEGPGAQRTPSVGVPGIPLSYPCWAHCPSWPGFFVFLQWASAVLTAVAN